MKKWMLFLIGSMSGIALAAGLIQAADLHPMVVNNPTGSLRIQQGIPCDDDVDQTTPVTQGRIEITPAQGVAVPGGRLFALTRVNVSFAPFSIHRSCLGFGETRSYTAVGVQLGQSVSFTAAAAAPGVYAVTIPKDDFVIYESAIVNGNSEAGQKRPSQDVTGTIDLAHGTVQMRVVVATRIHFRAGCLFGHCAIDETRNGSLTATLSGSITFPDADGDGVPDGADNCRFLANPDQRPVATPTITPPGGVTVASCAERRIGVVTAFDICDGDLVLTANDAPPTLLPGLNVVTWQAQDAAGRVATATQNVTVADRTPPIFTFVPPDIAVNTCGPVKLGLPTARDDCAGTPTITSNAPPTFRVGRTVVTWTATDGARNRATDTQTVTVTDTVRPAVACRPVDSDRDPTNVDAGGFFRVSSSDACTASPIIRIGDFPLAQGELINITQGLKAGVRLVRIADLTHTKYFEVASLEDLIVATDQAGNVGSASCGVPHEPDRDDRRDDRHDR